MSNNIEVKAYYPELERARSVSQALGATLLRQHHQRDTYFIVHSGRLKFRESSVLDPCVVYYNRIDSPEIRSSSYHLIHLPTDDLKPVLSAALGDRMIIEKYRETYALGNAIINLDSVSNLGSFVEIEVDADLLGSQQAHAEAVRLQCHFGFEAPDIVPWSYAELKAMNDQAQIWRSRLADVSPHGQLFLIDGPSGSGKTTIAQLLRSQEELSLIFARRHCTRPARSAEEAEYIFVSQEAFRSMARQGDFLEYRDFEFGMSYGLSWRETIEPLLAQRDVLAIMNWGNIRHARRLFPEAHFILVTAAPEALHRRLVARGTHTPAQIEERLANARKLGSMNGDHDLIVVNDDSHLGSSLRQIERFIRSRSLRASAAS